ncbi:MAG TPA: 16S rRNA (guanine(527)-N(7))-methyltransferase RsmG [Candidatus Limnocylindrales bacterium]|nr:16S rRNA (guanine(527)-N(7))-methyltransferase RsmG [Candidatus Limnocylindrales bacterium]
MTGPHARDRELLEAGSRELGAELDAAQTSALLTFLDQIYIWNRLAGLTTIPRENAVRLHLLDSLAARPFVRTGPCLDIGTGAGLPGLVLAVVLPAVRFVLVESNRKRCSFLSETSRLLRLTNVEIVQSDIRDLSRDHRYPTVISRAFRPPHEFLQIAGELVRDDGQVVMLMADPTADFLSELQRTSEFIASDEKRFVLPGGDEPRTIISFRPHS